MELAFTSKAGLGERLVAAGLISSSQLELARREQKRRGGQLSRLLVDLGFVPVDKISDFMARQAEARLVDLSRTVVDKAALDLVPLDIARRLRAIPISRINGSVTVAMADPLNVVAIDTLQQITGLQVEVVTAPERDILLFLDQLQNQGDTIQQSIDRIIQDETDEVQAVDETPAETAQTDETDAPIIRLVNQIIARAVGIGASDIHFEPEEKLMRIRMRIDGLLYPDVLIPQSMHALVTARMKILAEMDVAESRIPQDGRASVLVGQRHVNLRVSSLPTAYGENIVVRILDPSSQLTKISSLSLSQAMERQLRILLDKPHGVIIVTGPTGSGKTTTLYSILHEICTSDVSIFTLEDPVEFRMNGIRQTQIKEEVGLTFSTGLRALLRQDPDVILVGETRDTETAQLMVRAALTGHLVFSTLHTNDAPGAIPRLVDMGVEPYLLPDSLLAVLAQRLVRRICERCREPVPSPEKAFERLEIDLPTSGPLQLWRGVGCPVCKQSGYRGRQGIFELMTLDDRFHDAIVHRSGAPEYYRIAREGGMLTMFEDGVRRATLGTTTLEEVLHVTRLTPQ
jgi:type IV pilus assembly protein PilB